MPPLRRVFLARNRRLSRALGAAAHNILGQRARIPSRVANRDHAYLSRKLPALHFFGEVNLEELQSSLPRTAKPEGS
jgi:hypothetical protein